MEPTFDCIVDWLSGVQWLRVRVHSEPLFRQFASFGILKAYGIRVRNHRNLPKSKGTRLKAHSVSCHQENIAFLNPSRVVS